MDDATGCSNCGRDIDVPGQKFCPDCGQPTPAHRIDWHFLGHELEHSVLHMDRGILYSLKNLMLRPGHFVRDYIEGRRANHVKPLLLIMMTAAIVVVLSKYLNDGDVMNTAMIADAARASGDQDSLRVAKIYAAIGEWMNQHFAVSTLILIPLEALAFRLAFWRSGNLNYPEWLLITAFLTVQTFVLWALSLPLHRSHPSAMGWVLLASVMYAVFTLIQFFRDQPRCKIKLRTLAGFGLFFVSQWVVMLVITISVVVLG